MGQTHFHCLLIHPNFFLRFTAMNFAASPKLEFRRAPITRLRAELARFTSLKPSPELLKMKAASSEKEGKKLEGFLPFRGILSKQ